MYKEIEKLKQNNSELREIINNSWDGIAIIDKQGKLIYVNNAFSPILAYPKEEIVKKYFHNFMHQEYKEPFLKLIQSTINNKYANSMELACIRKDKKSVYLYVTLSQMLNQHFFVLNAMDITKQKSDATILNQYVISAHLDLNGNYTNVSDAFLYKTNYTKDELINKAFNSIVSTNETNIEFETIKQIVQKNNSFNLKLSFYTKDQNTLWFDTKIQAVYNKYGDTIAYTILMFDITQELYFKDKTISLSKEITDAKTQIKQKDQILADKMKLAIMAETLQLISHEWRQPLNLISLKAQKIELDVSFGNELSTNTLLEDLEQIKQKADELSQTIEEFHRFIKLKDIKSTISLYKIIEKAISIFDKTKNNSNIVVNIESKEDIIIDTYPNELSTILVNILTNASEAIYKNSIKNGKISIKHYIEGNLLFIEVIDNGGGIEQEILNKIFEPYFSTKEQKHGVGLGLYVCKIIIQTHLGGNIEVFNNTQGTTIKISLPIKYL